MVDLSKTLLGLKIKSNYSIKSKCLKGIIRKVLSDYKNDSQKKWEIKTQNVKKKISYGLKCEFKTKNENMKGVTLENKIGQQKSICDVLD